MSVPAPPKGETVDPVRRQLRRLLWSIAAGFVLLVAGYAVQTYLASRDQRVLYQFHEQAIRLTADLYASYMTARAAAGVERPGRDAASNEAAFVATAVVEFNRTLTFGDQLLALHAGPRWPYDSAHRRLARALAELRALRAEFQSDDAAFAHAFATRDLYIGIVCLQIERLHRAAATDLAERISARTRTSWLAFGLSALALMLGIAALSRRHLRAINAALLRERDTLDALRRSGARLEEAQRLAKIGSWELDHATGILEWSGEAYRIFERTPGPGGVAYAEFLRAVHPDDRDSANQAFGGAVRQKIPYEAAYRLLLVDGRVKDVQAEGRTLYDDLGNAVRSFGTVQDVTDRVRMEAQLLQSQKMESVGRLAGGIAHDFNNLLTAMLGNATLAMDGLSPDDERYGLLAEIIRAATSAASLTRQLLTFSRQQMIDPRVLNLNDVIARLRHMLQRLIGENIDLQVTASPSLGQVKIDPVQIEQIIINLAVNARDAMPDGGTLMLQTADVELDEDYCQTHPHARPGAFVVLSVSDTGTGISDQDKARIFEPFYTTKGPGQGTGLGLAVVYGAVKQHRGTIEVYSERGKGTSFKILLPRFDEQPEPLGHAPAPAPTGGTETIVLVEDEAGVREVAVRLLRRQGYTVHAYESGDRALERLPELSDAIDLLVTDVVMPGVNGQILAERIRSLRPGIKVLFASGYAESLVVHQGILDEGIEFIPKPYTSEQLARRVREALDRPC